MRDAVLAGLKAEFASVLKRQVDLNREMMRLPIGSRCKQWKEYYTRLDELAKRQQQIEAAAVFPHPASDQYTLNDIPSDSATTCK